MASPVPVFVSSATEDGDFCRQLDRHLGPLKRKQRISVWFEGMEELGSEAAKAALEELERASLIVLLVSADFLASEEERCWEEMERALARHREGEAQVMPVILRACGWRDAPFAEMRMRILPERPAGRVKAITSWRNRDEAFTQVTDALRELLEELGDEKKVEKKTVAPEEPVLTEKPSMTYPVGKPAASTRSFPAPKPVMGPMPMPLSLPGEEWEDDLDIENAPGEALQSSVISGKIGLERVGKVILELGEALSDAHERGIVHRDVKPANIVLDKADRSKLTNFKAMGAAFEASVYTAPECVSRPRHADARADVFGLGMTAIYCYRAKEILREEAKTDADREKLIAELPCSEAVREVLRKAVREERNERFDDAEAFCEAFRTALAV